MASLRQMTSSLSAPPARATAQVDLRDLLTRSSAREVAGGPLRILHIIGTINPSAGGPSESLRVLMTFSGKDYEGEVVSMDDPSSPFLKTCPSSCTRSARNGFPALA